MNVQITINGLPHSFTYVKLDTRVTPIGLGVIY